MVVMRYTSWHIDIFYVIYKNNNMKFNRFIFDNYLQTKEGKESLHFFNNFRTYIKKKDADIVLEFMNRQYYQEFDRNTLIDFMEDVNGYFKNNKGEIIGLEDKIKNITSIELAFDFFDSFIQEFIELADGNVRAMLPLIDSISSILYLLKPDYFFPYFFIKHFFKLEEIFNEFNIPMPIIPSKTKHKERLYYYFELCRSLFEFRNKNNMSPIELNCFLYYFAKNIIENIDIREIEFTTPSKVYISGATKYDCVETIEKANEETKTLWAGNVNTLPGDIILIYGVAPFSQINSIWRAISKGFIDPFSYWYNLIWVSNPIKIPAISYQELVENEIWGKKSIVKSNMQGVSGVQCTVEEYNEIKNLVKSKGFNVNILPEIIGPKLNINADLNIERDVEIYLLEPFLHKLGFTEKDWIRQMSLRMGRGERIYPDYAIKASTKRGEETAEFIWEAKFRITNQKKLLEDFFQAKSYALRLNSNGLVSRH